MSLEDAQKALLDSGVWEIIDANSKSNFDIMENP
ncbi:MAG: hypothetical protein ACI8WT_001680 [Clostridium sp.]|jgi:hypothetical protein